MGTGAAQGTLMLTENPANFDKMAVPLAVAAASTTGIFEVGAKVGF